MKTKRTTPKRILSMLLTLAMMLTLLPTVAFAAPGDVDINAATFPDANFRAYVIECNDADKDGVLSAAEIAAVTYIFVDGENITTLKGVEYFTALTSLDCAENQLTSLDVSKNTALDFLFCPKNQLTGLDVSKNTALEDLYCDENQLTALDVSKNKALKKLFCDENQLTGLDVSKNTALTDLYCGMNQLTGLDVSKNTALTTLSCYKNQLTDLDVSKNTALEYLDCSSNQLTDLDVSKNTALESLSCSSNQLTALDVSKNTALLGVDCDSNQLTGLDVSKNTALTTLSCYKNQLTGLDVSKNTALTGLYCGKNQLTALDVTQNTALEYLDCAENQLTGLDVSKNTALEYLNCDKNQLTGLDVSKNTELTSLHCSSNQLTALDVSKNTELTTLDCSSNSYSVSLVYEQWTSGYVPFTTLTFNTNGGSAISNISKPGGTTVDLASYKPTKTGYDFEGWYSDSGLTTKVTSITLTANTTVYAKWVEKTDGSGLPFTDVSDDAYYKDAVSWAVENGITEGTSPTIFNPNGICTRAQAATFLWRASGSPAPKTTTMPFNDVPAGSYYYNAVLWAVDQGIIKGTSETTFSPDMNCSRAHIFTMLWRMEGAKSATATNPFADVSGDAYYADAVLWAVGKNVTAGTSATTFSPDDNCTRAQIVTFIYRDKK